MGRQGLESTVCFPMSTVVVFCFGLLVDKTIFVCSCRVMH